MLLALAGCGDFWASDLDDFNRQGPLGRIYDRPAPAVAVTTGGPTGALVGGPTAPDVPDVAVDAAVAESLRPWLTPEERRSLAVTSQHAATAATGATLAWQAKNGGDETTASGTVTPVEGVFRSRLGLICRDLRQGLDKNGEKRVETVTLCRTTQASGITLWTVAAAD
jgi:hypothetical protein